MYSASIHHSFVFALVFAAFRPPLSLDNERAKQNSMDDLRRYSYNSPIVLLMGVNISVS